MKGPGNVQANAIVIVVALAELMSAIDVSIVNLSIPTISMSLDASTSVVSWVIVVYLLVLTTCLMIFGKIGDVRGYKKVFIAGFIVFLSGSFLCGISSDIVHLIAFRVWQAVGAAMISAVALPLISLFIPSQRRGAAFGYVTTFTSLGIVIGPTLGGLMMVALGWRWIFFINLPIGLVLFLLGLIVIPEHIPEKKTFAMDVTGAILMVLALVSLLFGMNMGKEFGWTSPVILGSFFSSAALWALFIFWETRCADPFLNLGLFSNRTFSLGVVNAVVFKLVASGPVFLLPFYFQLVLGYDVPTTGVLMVIPAVTMMLFGPVAGKLSDRLGSRWLCVAAAVASVISFLPFYFRTATIGMGEIIILLIVRGFAIGSFLPPNRRLIMGSSPRGDQGIASGIMKTMGNAGSAVGIVIFETIFAEILGATGNLQFDSEVDEVSFLAYTQAFQVVFLTGIAVSVICAVIALRTEEAPPEPE